MDPITEYYNNSNTNGDTAGGNKLLPNIDENCPCAINSTNKCNIVCKEGNCNNCELCSSNQMQDRMIQFLKRVDEKNKISYDKITNQNLLNLMKQNLGVNTEFEAITHPRFVRHVGLNIIQEEVKENFKPVGPVNHNLFSNFVIDHVLKQLGKWDPTFYPHEYNMVDFLEYKGSLTYHPSFYFNNNYKTFGCVINSDKSTGKGIHWMAIFGDFRESSGNTTNHGYTVEFFNSSGRAPTGDIKPFGIWLNNFAKQVQELTGKPCEPVIATNIQHQYSNTECGAYSLYYIFARLLGISYKKFREAPIPDKVVFEFRKKILNDEKSMK